MRIAGVSDCHGYLEPKHGLKKLRKRGDKNPVAVEFPEADVLVLAGDYAKDFGGTPEDGARFQLGWLSSSFIPFLRTLPYKKIIVVAGNHDWVHYMEHTSRRARELYEAEGIVYLQDESYEFEGVRFYGSPHQPWCFDWAFNFPRYDHLNGHYEAKKVWDKIPPLTHVLITHGPPFQILDLAPGDRHVGCHILHRRVFDIRPKLHLFGHIHGSYGRQKVDGVEFGNVSLCDEGYFPVNPIQVFEV